MAAPLTEVEQENYKADTEREPNTVTDNGDAPVPVSSDEEESMLVVTPKRDFYVSKNKLVKPVQETSRIGKTELVVNGFF